MNLCCVSLRGLPCFLEDGTGARGGSETQTALLASAMTARGHSVSAIVCDYDPAGAGRLRAPGVTLHNAYDLRDGVPGLRFLPRWRGLHQALVAADPEVVFTMSAGSVVGQIAWYCRGAGRGFVFGTASDTDVVPSRIRLGWRDRRLYTWGLRRADEVITQHGRQLRLLQRNFGIKGTPIGMSAHIPDALGSPTTPPTVLWLGNYRAVKRPELFLDVARAFPEVRFEMLGGKVQTEPDLVGWVEQEASKLPNVTFHGPTPDPSPFLERAWVLLNTSSVEGFPTSFLEAWAYGVPVVSYFDPGELIAQREMGILADSPESMADGLRRILESRDLRDTLGQRGRDYVVSEHAESVVTDRFERVLARAAEAHRGA